MNPARRAAALLLALATLGAYAQPSSPVASDYPLKPYPKKCAPSCRGQCCGFSEPALECNDCPEEFAPGVDYQCRPGKLCYETGNKGHEGILVKEGEVRPPQCILPHRYARTPCHA